MLEEGVSGMSILEGGQWYIVYNDGENAGRRRFTIAHEMGHIFLGHELRGVHRRTFARVRPQEEIDADNFAVRLLAPACVLWGLNLHTAEEIQKACGLSKAAAENRAKRMEVLYERNKFLTSPLERRVYENFREWIERNKK
jgi:Zn-dependent peptidase ImmA (M78 family)